MYPVLILRCEVVCLVILVFLWAMSRQYHIDKDSKVFKRLLNFAILHVIFDLITVLTVNHMETVPEWTNWTCHALFYITAILYANEMASYVVRIVYPRYADRLYAGGHILTLLYIFSLPFLKIEYALDIGTYSSTGSAAYIGYSLAFSFFIIALIIIFTHLNQMSMPIKSALIPMMLVLMVTEISQVVWRSVLFTGGAITIVTVGFFFSLENPVEVFKQKAMTDALTGVRTRSSFEEDILQYNKEFQERPGSQYSFVFCDIDGLRNVNNRFGHSEGDTYISLIASSLINTLKKKAVVYRTGGDEFVVVYYRVATAVIEKELQDLQEVCNKASEQSAYPVGVSVGYATSSPDFKSLQDVIKTADYAMYQHKARKKAGNIQHVGPFGAKLNYEGLTDKMFDVMCASNNRHYPFVTNLQTNVTRIAPAWKEYFGLEDEFFSDFMAIWKDRIHPDDYEGYMADVIEVLNGHKKYHNYDYSAKKADGTYVKVSCHGSLYEDSNNTPYFTGYIENFGIEK